MKKMHDKNKAYNFIMNYHINNIDNSGKLLFCKNSKGRTAIFERDRQNSVSYYLISIKSNYIQCTEIKYLDSNLKGVNTFITAFIHAFSKNSASRIITIKKILFKIPLKNYKDFCSLIKLLAPNLYMT